MIAAKNVSLVPQRVFLSGVSMLVKFIVLIVAICLRATGVEADDQSNDDPLREP
jgi:hypothetical protein